MQNEMRRNALWGFGGALLCLLPTAANAQAQPPREWTPGYVQFTLRTWNGEPAEKNIEIEVLDFWNERASDHSDRQMIWFARRERPASPDGQIEVVSSQACPAVRRALEAFQALPTPRANLLFEVPGDMAIEPTRKDGEDFRISYRSSNGEQVRLRFLSNARFQWATATRASLIDCWKDGWRLDRNAVDPIKPRARPD
ncbi:hypothetical protein D3C72_1314130 [compost metagenome]